MIMLDLKLIRDNTAAVEAALKKRGPTDYLGPLRRLDEERRRLATAADEPAAGAMRLPRKSAAVRRPARTRLPASRK